MLGTGRRPVRTRNSQCATIARRPARRIVVNNTQEFCVVGRIMPGGRPPSFNPFTCPNCGAHYQVVKVAAGRETDDREINCRSCGAPLAGREGKFVLKYSLLRKAARAQRRS